VVFSHTYSAVILDQISSTSILIKVIFSLAVAVMLTYGETMSTAINLNYHNTRSNNQYQCDTALLESQNLVELNRIIDLARNNNRCRKSEMRNKRGKFVSF